MSEFARYELVEVRGAEQQCDNKHGKTDLEIGICSRFWDRMPDSTWNAVLLWWVILNKTLLVGLLKQFRFTI